MLRSFAVYSASKGELKFLAVLCGVLEKTPPLYTPLYHQEAMQGTWTTTAPSPHTICPQHWVEGGSLHLSMEAAVYGEEPLADLSPAPQSALYSPWQGD